MKYAIALATIVLAVTAPAAPTSEEELAQEMLSLSKQSTELAEMADALNGSPEANYARDASVLCQALSSHLFMLSLHLLTIEEARVKNARHFNVACDHVAGLTGIYRKVVTRSIALSKAPGLPVFNRRAQQGSCVFESRRIASFLHKRSGMIWLPPIFRSHNTEIEENTRATTSIGRSPLTYSSAILISECTLTCGLMH